MHGRQLSKHINIQASDLNRCIEILLRNPQPIWAHSFVQTWWLLISNIEILIFNKPLWESNLCVNHCVFRAPVDTRKISVFYSLKFLKSLTLRFLRGQFSGPKSQTFSGDGKTVLYLFVKHDFSKHLQPLGFYFQQRKPF